MPANPTKIDGDHYQKVLLADKLTGAPLDSTDGKLDVNLSGGGIVDDNNSTNVLLDSGEVFIGTSTEIKDFGIIYITTKSDVSSAIDGLSIQQSSNGINWDHTDEYTVDADSGKTFSFQAGAQYFRIVYTNGGIAQGYFRLQTLFKNGNGKASSHRIQDAITTEDDCELVKSVLSGENDKKEFVNFRATNKGNFKVSLDEYGDTPSIDAFARLRISEPFTLFDSKQLHDKQPLFWDESIGGSATSVHNSINAETSMNVTASASDFVIRQTKQRFNYQPGKSQLIFMTFNSPQVTGITSRIGIFDGIGVNNLTPNNGIFFECDGNLSWNIAKNGVVEESITQSNWNVDKLDGTGQSSLTFNPEYAQILIIDFEWLGVGRVRVGFVIDGLIIYVHNFNHANADFSSVYMSTPNLPARYSIESDGTNASSLKHICSSIISEGGIEKTGVLRAVETGDGFITNYGTSNNYALIGIRLKDVYKDITVIPEAISLLLGTNDSFKWTLELNPTINGTFTYNDLNDSSVQYAIGTTSNTLSARGLLISAGGASTQTRQTEADLKTALRIGSTIGGVNDELVLVIRPLSSNASFWASLSFRELL